MKEPRFVQAHRVDDRALAAEAATGLLGMPAATSPKFFYDLLGSRLFDAITELDEYYLTRTEAAIFAEHGAAIADAALGLTGAAPVLIDVGAGACTKARRWIDALHPRRYVAVDISVDFLRLALAAVQREHPALDVVGVGLDFSRRLQLPGEVRGDQAVASLAFFAGSSIGNFAPREALALLRDLHELAAGGALLIGADLVKPAATLEAAYDDALGVTAAFNLNLLVNLNHLLGADFRVQQWRHRARFDERESRIEMHLEAREALVVRWPGGERRFEAGERIHTESSYKWRPEAFEALLREAGFAGVRVWTDRRAWYGVFLARA